MFRRRRVARRTGRRAARRTMRRRRIFRPAPVMYRRPLIRRPLGGLLIMGAAAGVAYKLGKNQAQQIQDYTGYPPDQLSEEDLQAAMTDLNIQSEPLDEQDRQDIAAAQASQASSVPDQEAAGASSDGDYIEEIQRLAGLRDAGIISTEEFEAKKQQLLGL